MEPLGKGSLLAQAEQPKMSVVCGIGGDPGDAACAGGCREIPAALRPIMQLPKHREKVSWSSQIVLEFDPKPWLI